MLKTTEAVELYQEGVELVGRQGLERTITQLEDIHAWMSRELLAAAQAGQSTIVPMLGDARQAFEDLDQVLSALKTMRAPEALKQAKLDAQWPKRCACGRCYRRDAHSSVIIRKTGEQLHTWTFLPLAKTERAPDGRFSDAFATFELRNCACGSTLMVAVKIHDLSAE